MNDLFHAPLYIQIENLLEKKILSKEFLPGSKIPSERDLAIQYGVNRMTVKKAIDALREKGLLYRKQGSGTYVTSSNVDKENVYFNLFSGALDVDFKNVSLYDYMDSKKHRPVHISQFIQVVPALKKEARLLKTDEGSLLYYIVYLGYDEQNNAVEYTESYLVSDEPHLQFTLGGILGDKETY